MAGKTFLNNVKKKSSGTTKNSDLKFLLSRVKAYGTVMITLFNLILST